MAFARLFITRTGIFEIRSLFIFNIQFVHGKNLESNVFSEVKGITIQQFIIIHKIERVKELLLYDEFNLTEISFRMNYSSVSHLSNQFKKIRGFTPSYFKKMKKIRNKGLEHL